MKAWLIPSVMVILAGFAGCGGSTYHTTSTNTLTQAQARQVATALSNDVSKALASAFGSTKVPLDISAKGNVIAALRRNSPAGSVARPEDINCTGSACTVSGTFNCPDGGSIMVSGTFSASGTSATGTFTATPSSCSDGTLVINGDPNVTTTVQGSDNGITTTVNLMIVGGVSFAPVQPGKFPSGSCSLNVTANFSVNDSTGSVTGSTSGSLCGQTIN